jgi:heme O synthase-like polyprenyltransferase
MTIIVAFYIIFATVFSLVIAPKICANIAFEKGMDYKKWFFNAIVFNLLAVIYLALFILKNEDREYKRTLFLISLGYIGIFVGAYLIDTYTDF